MPGTFVPRRTSRCLTALLLVGLWGPTLAPVARADEIDDVHEAIGLTSLAARLGSAMLTGQGIEFTQVEFPSNPGGTAFLPNASQIELAGKTFIDQTGGGIVSSHATGVGRVAYGSQGVAPGVSTIHVYSTVDWLSDGYLRTESDLAPLPSVGRVQNHSWVVVRDNDPGNDAQEDAQAADSLRRLDLAIDRDGIVAVVGVNNGSGTTVPLLLANGYNAIAVGQSNAGSSLGPSTVDVPGRVKPDLVAPGDFPSATPTVSRATGRVSAAAALLLEAAGSDADASRPEIIKALLLSGATKNEFDLTGSTPSTVDDWSHTSTQPLDLRYGAGELNIDHSQQILAAGQHEATAGQLVSTTGWDLDTLTPGSQRYFFRVPEGSTVESFTATATWHREIGFVAGEGGTPATLTPTLANVNLRLYAAEPNAARTAYQVTGSAIEASVSAIDNVEHVFTQTLGPGLYALELAAQAGADVGFAWDLRATAGPERPLTVAGVDGRHVGNLTASGPASIVADAGDGLLTPLDVAYDAQGRLYVADTLRSQIIRYDAVGVGTVFADAGDGIVAPSGLSFDAAGNLYASSYLTDTIRRITPAGAASLFADAADGLDGPFGMTFDQAGNLIVASLDNRSVLSLNPAGAGSLVADAADGLFTPIDVAFDEYGDLFIADTLANKVFRLDGAGALTTFAGAADGVVSPAGLVFDADGDLLVANYLVDTIVRLDPLGNSSLFAGSSAGINGPWGLALAPVPQPPASGWAWTTAVSVPEPGVSTLLLGAAASLAAWLGCRRRVGKKPG